MTTTTRFILADPVNWECVEEALESSTPVLRVKCLYEIRDKGARTLVIGFDRVHSGRPAREDEREIAQLILDLFGPDRNPL